MARGKYSNLALELEKHNISPQMYVIGTGSVKIELLKYPRRKINLNPPSVATWHRLAKISV